MARERFLTNPRLLAPIDLEKLRLSLETPLHAQHGFFLPETQAKLEDERPRKSLKSAHLLV